MVQAPSPSRAAAPPPSQGGDAFVFDIRNGLRVWMSEAVKRGEVAAADAEASIRAIDAAKAVDTAEDYVKLLTGPIKDGFGSIGIAKKLVGDFGKWWAVHVYFKAGAKGDLVIIRGWPNGRQLLSGTRYRVDNPKIMELQIGKPGIQAAAKESARFGVYLVVAVDFIQFVRDRDLAHLLGSLTVDIPSVLLASAIGAAAGVLVAGTVIGTFALGPALVAFGVGVLVGGGLFWLDQRFDISKRVTAAYRRGLDKLQKWWETLGPEANRQWNSFVNSAVVRDVEKGFDTFGRRLGEGNNALLMLSSLN